jgi:hypothetical protein
MCQVGGIELYSSEILIYFYIRNSLLILAVDLKILKI